MNKKDIALTVGGIVAGLTLTYLLYRLQKRDAAQAAASAAAAQDASDQQQTNEASYTAQLPQISFQSPSYSSGSVDPTASDGTDIGASTEGLFADILAAFTSSVNTNPGTSLIIPTETATGNSLATVPTTVQGAQAGVPANTISPGTTQTYTPGSGVTLSPSMNPPSTTVPVSTQPSNGIIFGGASGGYNNPVETLQGPGSL